MELLFASDLPDAPPIEPVAPSVSDEERRLARLPRPPALPSQCRPWERGQRYGYVLRFAHRARVSVLTHPDHGLVVGVERGAGRAFASEIVSRFAAGYVGLATGYRIRTPSRVGLLIEPHPASGERWGVVRALVETWWYPRPMFLVLRAPPPGDSISVSFGDPLCLLIPVLCETLHARAMDEAEAARIGEEDRAYIRRQRDPSLQWTSAEGTSFSRAYRVESAARRRAGAGPG